MWADLRTLLPGALILAVFIALRVALPVSSPFGGPAAGAAEHAPIRESDPAIDTPVAAFVTALLVGDPRSVPSHPALDGEAGPAYVALRSEGLKLAEAWGQGPTRPAALAEAIDAARASIPKDIERVDAVEISIGLPVDPIDTPGERGRLTNVHRGVFGLRVALNGDVIHFAPTQMIASNLSFGAAMERAAVALGVSAQVIETTADLATFAAEQLIVTTGPTGLTWLFRGNQVVCDDAVTATSTAELASGLGEWLTRNVDPSGRMTYLYWPSRGEESDSNNSIRQWMATLALERLAAHEGDQGIQDLAARNIAYNLAEFYKADGDLGLIVDPDGDAKLGAAALAALAIIEHPERERFSNEEAALRRTVDELARPDGSFVTFHRPEGRNDNQNFYPGEALLMWAKLLSLEGDPELHDRFMRSFRYYRDWHREQRNPAFVPWHTQAYVAEWERTGDAELKAFVYEMNDWLLGLQQWDEAEYPDLKGRFYDPGNPQYGPPHAASDGVYLEGLAAAYRMAEADGDGERTARYGRAIARALRNAMQLQFADHVDRYYVSRPGPVAGGMRTTPYDNEIRVDNVQHTLMGALEVLQLFDRTDFVRATADGP